MRLFKVLSLQKHYGRHLETSIADFKDKMADLRNAAEDFAQSIGVHSYHLGKTTNALVADSHAIIGNTHNHTEKILEAGQHLFRNLEQMQKKSERDNKALKAIASKNASQATLELVLSTIQQAECRCTIVDG